MIHGSTRQRRPRWDGKSELSMGTSKRELCLKIMCKNPVLSHRRILFSFYRNQKIIAAYFQNHMKHTTAPCLKNIATFILIYWKKYISHSALEDYTNTANTCVCTSLTWCVIELCGRLHHPVELWLGRTHYICRICLRAGLIVLTKRTNVLLSVIERLSLCLLVTLMI